MAHPRLAGVLRHLRTLLGAGSADDASDGVLLERFTAQHDQSAFAALVQRHGSLVLGVCRRVLGDADDVEDAFQATFVVLVRRAHSLKREGSLGSWLYGVAYRVSLKARAGVSRRRSRERQADNMPDTDLHDNAPAPENTDPANQASFRELQGTLDDEVNRLPEKYRAPVVLCYFEGKTNEQAARELGWPSGSMSTRLERAREMLRQRLTGRGVALPAGLLATTLAAQSASATVPVALIDATVYVVSGSAGALPAPVALLADSVVQGFVTAKVKLAATMAVVFCTVGLAGGFAAHKLLSNPADPAPPPGPFTLLADSVGQRVEQWQPTKAERKFDEVGWTTNLLDGLKLAKQHNRPLFVFTHSGHMNLGRSGGAGFGMRARSLNDGRINALLNRYFVPVYLSNDDVRKDATASEEERAERTRIYHQSMTAKFPVGDECVYFLTPDGQPFDAAPISKANRTAPMLEKLEQVVAKLTTPSGKPVVEPRSQSARPDAAADALVLHLTARVLDRNVWCEFPGENWLVLPHDRWTRLLPSKPAAIGDSWAIDPEVSASILTYFYPQTENNNATLDRIHAQNLHATVMSVEDGVVQVRLDGSLRMKHLFYESHPDDRMIDATVVGVMEYETYPHRIRSLRLVTERATYGEWKFGVAVRSVP